MSAGFALAAGIVYLVLPTVLFWRIAGKAGFPTWYALIGLVPVLNVIALWLFAYVDWPSRRALPRPGP